MYITLLRNVMWHLVRMLALHTHIALVQMFYEVMAVKNKEQAFGILILYSLRSSCVSNTFSVLVGISAVKRLMPASRMALLRCLLCQRELTHVILPTDIEVGRMRLILSAINLFTYLGLPG